MKRRAAAEPLFALVALLAAIFVTELSTAQEPFFSADFADGSLDSFFNPQVVVF
jgi:hypothetical protein